MKTLIKSLTAVLVAATVSANAAEVTSLGQAISLCRAEAMTVNDDYLRSKSSRMKETRAGYSIKLKVYLPEKSVTSTCDIQRDGTLNYAQE